MPESVEAVGIDAFSGCARLTEVIVKNKKLDLNNSGLGLVREEREREINGEIVYEIEIVAMPGLTIYGYEGSSAEAYAVQKGINFVQIQ